GSGVAAPEPRPARVLAAPRARVTYVQPAAHRVACLECRPFDRRQGDRVLFRLVEPAATSRHAGHLTRAHQLSSIPIHLRAEVEADADVITILQPYPDVRRAKGTQRATRLSDGEEGEAVDLTADDMVRCVVRGRDIHPRVA